ncbi:MAG TPA: hypothetical protein VKA74_14370 [Myxococcota bacterium]|nr:hypothetical protein [Myxococcota bacterium]
MEENARTERKIEIQRRQALWIERLAWNAAAAAVLLGMIWVLLCSLTWLDRIAPSPLRGRERAALERPEPPGGASGPERTTEGRARPGPSG